MAKLYVPPELYNENFIYHRVSNQDTSYQVLDVPSCSNIIDRGQGNFAYMNCKLYYVYPSLNYAYTSAPVNTFSYNVNTSQLFNFDDITTSPYYRIDIADIMIIFTILFIFIILIPYKIVSRLFGRWLKV